MGTKLPLQCWVGCTIAVDDVTGFPEMMDGRVEDSHPNIHGGLLACSLDSHLEAAKDNNNIELIDLVVASNSLPIQGNDSQNRRDLATRWRTSIGPSMPAAKNHASVTVVVDPADYAVADEFCS